MRTSIKPPKKIHLQVSIIYQQKRRLRFTYRMCLLLCLFFGFTALQEARAQRTFVSNVNGNHTTWNDPDAWIITINDGDINKPLYPVAGDHVIIDSSDDMELNQNGACASVQIRNTGNNNTTTLEINAKLTTGSVTIIGGNSSAKSHVLIGGSGTLAVNGNLNFTPGSPNTNAKLEFTGGGTLEIGGILDTDGTFQKDGNNSCTVLFNGTSPQSIPMNYDYANIQTSNLAGVTPSANITATKITGNIVVSNGIFNNGGFSITGATGKKFEVNSGATFIASGTSSFPSFPTYNLINGSTVRYAGSNQFVAGAPVSYSNLIIEGTGTKTLSSNMTATGNISVEAGTFNNGGFIIQGTGSGKFEVKSGATFTASGTSSFPSFLTYDLIYGSTVRYAGSNQSVAGIPYSNLIIEGSDTKTLTNNMTATGNISVETGTFNNGGFNIQETGWIPGNFEVKSGATFTASGTSSLPYFTAFNLRSGSTVRYAGSNQSVAGIPYSNLIIEGTGTKTLSSNLTATGNISVEAGTFNNGGFNIQGTGSGNFEVKSGATFTASGTSSFPSFPTYNLMNGSTVRYAGSNQSVAGIPYSNLIIEGSGTKTLSNHMTANGNISVAAGTFNNGGFLIQATGSGNFEVKSGATFTASGTSSFPSFTAFNLIPGSTVRYAGSTQSVAGIPYSNLIIEGSGTKTLSNHMTANGNISVEAGTFNNGGFIIQGTGSSPGNFELKSGTTFIASGSTSLPNDFTNTFLENNSTVNYNGSNQMIAPATYGNLILNGTGTKTLSGPITITKPLDLSNNGVILGNHNLTVRQTGSILNYSNTNYIKQTGTGKLIMEDLGPGGITTERIFPIGTSTSFTPAYITNTGNKSNFSVHVTDNIKDINNQIVTDNVVKKTWDVKEEPYNTGTANITLKLQWNAIDEGNYFLRSHSGIFHYTGGDWVKPGSYSDATTTLTASLSGISTFSPFGVSNPYGPLPVELISFNATRKDNAAYLQWVTASEKNNKGFHIQTSADGRNFEDVAFVASRNPNSSTTQQYDFLDKTVNATGLHYYRLKQTDFDGKVSFSGIKVVNFGKELAAPVIYPNPFNKQINFNIQADKDEELSYQLIDMTGKTVYKNAQKLNKGNNTLQINLDKEYPTGFYLLRTQSGSGITTNRLIKQ